MFLQNDKQNISLLFVLFKRPDDGSFHYTGCATDSEYQLCSTDIFFSRKPPIPVTFTLKWEINTSWTGDADLSLYITTVQDG